LTIVQLPRWETALLVDGRQDLSTLLAHATDALMDQQEKASSVAEYLCNGWAASALTAFATAGVAKLPERISGQPLY